MPLIDEYRALLDQLASAEAPALTEMPVEAAREMFRIAQPPRPDLEVGKVSDSEIEGRNGEIPLRIYTPKGEGPFPITMMFHGGGWVIGDLDTADSQCREVCNGADCVVVSVDYRLAPEHRFPTAAEDCFDATVWTHQNAEELDADANRLAVSGDSAGGNLAAVVAQMARDQDGPPLVYQLLVYPVTNGATLETPSYVENADGYMLTAAAMRWFWNHYAGDEERTNSYASPLCSINLSNLPPACVMVAEFDPLRDEGIAYGEAMADAGTEVTSLEYPGFIHGFFSHTQTIPPTQKAMQDACRQLKNAFNP